MLAMSKKSVQQLPDISVHVQGDSLVVLKAKEYIFPATD